MSEVLVTEVELSWGSGGEEFEVLLDLARVDAVQPVMDAIRSQPGLVFMGNEVGITLLHQACGRNNVGLVDLLLSSGSNVHQKARDGSNALMFASARGHQEAAALLCKHGAELDATNCLGMTALALSTRHDRFNVAALLVAQGSKLVNEDLVKYGQLSHPRERVINDSEDKVKKCLALKLLYENGPHPSQVQRRKDLTWARRWPFMSVLFDSRFLPLAARRRQLEQAAHMLDSSTRASIPRELEQRRYSFGLNRMGALANRCFLTLTLYLRPPSHILEQQQYSNFSPEKRRTFLVVCKVFCNGDLMRHLVGFL